MSKRERIVRLKLQVADLKQELAALKQIVAQKADRTPLYWNDQPLLSYPPTKVTCNGMAQ